MRLASQGIPQDLYEVDSGYIEGPQELTTELASIQLPKTN